MIISTRIAKMMLFAALFVAALIYLVFANSISESDMVSLSHLWVPTAVTGAAILIKKNHTLKFTLTWFVGALLSMIIFFRQIFPML